MHSSFLQQLEDFRTLVPQIMHQRTHLLQLVQAVRAIHDVRFKAKAILLGQLVEFIGGDKPTQFFIYAFICHSRIRLFLVAHQLSKTLSAVKDALVKSASLQMRFALVEETPKFSYGAAFQQAQKEISAEIGQPGYAIGHHFQPFAGFEHGREITAFICVKSWFMRLVV
jgi:hypothetical protein